MLEEFKEQLNLSDEEIEKINKEKNDVKVNKLLLLISLALGLLLFLAFKFDLYQFTVILVVFLVISIVLMIVLYVKELNEYNLIIKEVLVTKMFESEFDNVNYQPQKGFDKKYIDDTNLIGSGNTYSSDDLLSGSYKGIGFILADIFLEQVTHDDKHTTRVTIFKGRWIVCDFIKEFDGYHQIRSKEGFFSNKKPSRFFGRSSKLIKFEDYDFNNEFSTYSDNEKEAFYLISPNYMNKIKDLRYEVNAPFVLGFVDNKLHIAINNDRDAFEIKGRGVDQRFIDSVYAEMELVKYILENLELDLDIFR